MEYELERRLETVETTYVKIGGEEFKAGLVLDFLQRLEGTGYAKRMGRKRRFVGLADVLIEEGVVHEYIRGTWRQKEKGVAKELHDKLTERYLKLDKVDEPVPPGPKGLGYCFGCHTEFGVEKVSAECPNCGEDRWVRDIDETIDE